MINIIDISRNTTTNLTQLKPKHQHYKFYANSTQLQYSSFQQLQQLIEKAHKSNHLITCCKRKQSKQTKTSINPFVRQRQLKTYFSQQRYELIKKQPTIMFKNSFKEGNKFRYNYLSEITQQEKKQLKQMLESEKGQWSKKSLQELQYVGSIYYNHERMLFNTNQE